MTILVVNLFISVKNDIGICYGGILIYFRGTKGFKILIWGYTSAKRLRTPELPKRKGWQSQTK
jgi:hypothetical protein